MNKEEIKLYKDLLNDTKGQLAIEIIQKNRELDELEDIIYKAIEYLKENACYTDNNEFVCDLRYDNCEELLDILKGSDTND